MSTWIASPIRVGLAMGVVFGLWNLAHTRRFAAIVAFITFCVYDALVILRINLFLNDLTGRADWQSMVRRFRAGESDNLHKFVTMEYIKGSPLKIGVATAIGTAFGSLGASLGRFMVRLEDAKVVKPDSSCSRP